MAQVRVQLNAAELRTIINILEPAIVDMEDIKLLTKLKRSYVSAGGDMIGLGVEPTKKVTSNNEIERINMMMVSGEEISDEDKALYYQLTGTEI